MKRTDPATDLAERAIRQWQMSGLKTERHDLAKRTEVIPAEVRAEGGISTFTVGSVAGFLGAITCLICNIAGALVLGVEPLRLLRIYATILEGRVALDISRADFFISFTKDHCDQALHGRPIYQTRRLDTTLSVVLDLHPA